MTQESVTETPAQTDTDREIRQWAVERAIDIGPRTAGVSPAQRRADVIATAKELEAYVTGRAKA